MKKFLLFLVFCASVAATLSAIRTPGTSSVLHKVVGQQVFECATICRDSGLS